MFLIIKESLGNHLVFPDLSAEDTTYNTVKKMNNENEFLNKAYLFAAGQAFTRFFTSTTFSAILSITMNP